jgi:hypothetical protein
VKMQYFSDNDDPSEFMKALAEARRIGTREGWCYHHVQAIIVAIDQYAHATTRNREYFWNEPHSTPEKGAPSRPRGGDIS